MTLTPAQKALLAELRSSGTLYIRTYTNPWRTVVALERKGLARRSEPDYSSLGMDGWVAADLPVGEPKP